MDQAVQLITQFGTKLAELATQVGPEVFALAMAAIVVTHVGNLLMGVALVVIGIITLRISYGRLRAGKEIIQENGRAYVHDHHVGQFFMAGISAFVGLIFLGTGLFEHLLNVWNWAALYDPRLVVAKRVLGL